MASRSERLRLRQQRAEAAAGAGSHDGDNGDDAAAMPPPPVPARAAAAHTAVGAAAAAKKRLVPAFSILQAQQDLFDAVNHLETDPHDDLPSSSSYSFSNDDDDNDDGDVEGDNNNNDDSGPSASSIAPPRYPLWKRADPLLDLLAQHNSKQDDLDLRELLELISQPDLVKMWTVTSRVVARIASDQAYLMDAVDPLDPDAEAQMSIEESLRAEERVRSAEQDAEARAQEALDTLYAVASLVLVAVSSRKKAAEAAAATRPPTTQLFDTLSVLHSMLFSLALSGGGGEGVTVIIARCCERWWTLGWANRELLVTQLLPYLLASSMAEKATMADVKRLNNVRHSLELIDFEDEGAETIRSLLLRAVRTPIFLRPKKKRRKKKKKKKKKTKKKDSGKDDDADDDFVVEEEEEEEEEEDDDDPQIVDDEAAAAKKRQEEEQLSLDAYSGAMSEGQKVLSFAFGLNGKLSVEMYEAMKEYLPSANKSAQITYGIVLFRAWKTAAQTDAKMRDVLEEHVIQDLMDKGVRIAEKSMFTAIRRVLQAFKSQKRQDGVDEMLLRLYNPIIWRSLKAANPEVRRQSCILLFDAFPLQNPSLPNVEGDALLQMQFTEIERLLLDPVPSVRIVAVEGCSRILTAYWDLIPVRFVKTMLTTMVDRLCKL